MSRPRTKPSAKLIDNMLGEVSWLLSHAQALSDYRRPEEASAEYARAGLCEEQVAGLLDADGQEMEAAIHRVSAASCYERLAQYTRAVTLLRAALAVRLHEPYRSRVEQALTRCLRPVPQEMKQLSKRAARRRAPISSAG